MTGLLYCPVGEEILFQDFDEAVHAASIGLDEGAEIAIEVWSVHDPSHHLPSAESTAEWVIEWACEWGELVEWVAGDYIDLRRDAEVLAAVQAVLDLISAKIKGRMADQLIEVRVLRATSSIPSPD